MATQSITANLKTVSGETFDGVRSIPSKFSKVPRSTSGVRLQPQREERSSEEHIRQVIARTEHDAKLVSFYLNWWPFDLLRSLGHWLQCWGCAFAVRMGSNSIPNARVRNNH